MQVKTQHPLSELIAQILFNIESVPEKEQRRMVQKACSSAERWYTERVKRFEEIEARIKRLENVVDSTTF